ncbi:MAG: metal-dependent transcriptional regulator [Promethearchaeota archaeon]
MDSKVLKLLQRENKPIKVGDIARKLEIKHSTMGSCIKRLEENGYVIYNRYEPVYLSNKGRNLANELIRHCQLLEVLLFNELGLEKGEAHSESEKFNLLLSCNTVNKICEKYGHPKLTPCGEKVYNSGNCYCREGH